VEGINAKVSRSMQILNQTRHGGLEVMWLKIGVDFGDLGTGVAKELIDLVDCAPVLHEP